MAAFDQHTKIFSTSAFNLNDITTSTSINGNIIDTLGLESLEFLIYAGTITDGNYTPSFKESDDNFSTSNDVDTDFLVGTIANASFDNNDSNKVKRIGYIGKKRYVRITIDSTNVTTGGTIGSVTVQEHARTQPTEGS